MGNEKRYSLPAIAATLGSLLAGKVGVSVKFADVPTACTDGKTVWLSSRLKTDATEGEAAILRGFLAHEILGHVHNTDFEQSALWTQKQGSPLAKAILNIIEDGRIERAAWRTYPAVRGILARCVDALVAEGRCFSLPDASTPPEGVLKGLLLSHVRRDLGQNLDPSPFEALAFPMFGGDLCRKMVEIALKGARSPVGVEGNTGSITAAQEILDLLQDQGQDQSGQGQSGQDQSGQGQSGQEERQRSAAKQALEGQNPGLSDLGSAIEAILSGDEDVGNHIAKVKTGPMEDEMKIVRLNDGDLPDLQAKAAANRLAARLEQLLEAKTNRRDVYGEEGRLCGRRLVNAAAGDQQVFRRVTGEKDGLDVAVSLLIDCSRSMSGNDMELARATGYAVAEALSKFESQGIALEVKGFNDRIYTVKEFHESFPSRSKAFSRLKASGGTAFQPTVIQSVKTLAIRRETRKIVLFITDGDLGEDPAILVNTLKTQGIEVRGVLVGNEDESFFEEAEIEHFGCAKDASAIPAAVFKAMEKDVF